MPDLGVSYKVPALSAVLLFIAIAPLPYGFYTFMRIIVCGCAGYMAYQASLDKQNSAWLWVLGFIAILFNPITTIHMTKEIWMVVDFVTGIFFTMLAHKAYVYQKGRGGG